MAFSCFSTIINIATKNNHYFRNMVFNKLCNSQMNNMKRYLATAVQPKDNRPIDHQETLETVKKCSLQDILDNKVFAIVHIGGKQFKIANNDVIMIHKKIEAECGDVIRLEKVLAIGGRNFTLIGQPLLKRELATIEGVVVEKTKGEKKIAFKKSVGRTIKDGMVIVRIFQ